MISWLIVIFISILLASITAKYPSSLNRNTFSFLMALLLGWFVSFGGKALTDQLSYYQLYQSIENSNILSGIQLLFNHFFTLKNRANFEAGYVFLNIVFSKLGFGYVGFLFIYSVLLNYLIFKIFSESEQIVLITIVFLTTAVFIQQANLVRQMMAVSLFAYSIKYIISKNFLKYLIFILLGSTLHMSMLILLPFYFIVNRHFPKYILIIIYALSVFINFYKIELEILNTFMFFYYDTKLEKFGREEEELFNISLNLFFILSLIFFDNTNDICRKSNIYFNFFFIGVVLSNIMVLSFGFYRISLYFIIFSIIIISKIPLFFSENSLVKKQNLSKYNFLLYVPLVFYFSRILIRRILSPDTYTLGSEFYSLLDFFK